MLLWLAVSRALGDPKMLVSHWLGKSRRVPMSVAVEVSIVVEIVASLVGLVEARVR